MMTQYSKKSLFGFGFAIFISNFVSNSILAIEKIVIDSVKEATSINSTLNTLSGLNESYKFKNVKEIHLPNGVTRYKYVQYYNDIPVWNTTIVADKKNIADLSANDNPKGSYFINIEEDIQSVVPSLNRDVAIQIAKIRKAIINESDIKNINVSLVIKDYTDLAKLVYVVDFFMDKATPERPFFIIDANSGEILEEWNGLATVNYVKATGPGGNAKIGKYIFGTDYNSLIASQSGNDCSMDSANVSTYNLNHSQNTNGGTLHKFTCLENTYQEINGGYSPINDAHYFGNIVHDMYQTWFNTPPLNFKLKLKVHYGYRYENAYWNGSLMVFGDGGSSFYPLVSVDVVGHEISHGFTEHHSNLVYQDQSGGMNEAYSDIAGQATEYYMNLAKPENQRVDWMIGEKIFKGPRGKALRYFDDPTRDGYSISNAKDYTAGMEVHASSGIYNKAFYTLANTNGWDLKKAFSVFVVANQSYWTQNSTFDQGACGVKRASDDLNYNSADVVNAFKAVGVNAQCAGTNPTPPTDPNVPPKEPTDPQDPSNDPTDPSHPTPSQGNAIQLNDREWKTVSGAAGSNVLYYIDVVGFNLDFLTTGNYGGNGTPIVNVAYNRLPTAADNDCNTSYNDNTRRSCLILYPKIGRYYIELSSDHPYSDVRLLSGTGW